MNRRSALKNITLSMGYALAAPAALSILQSCKTDIEVWNPTFLTQTQGFMITKLSDIIIPVTETAGSLDVNVPEFIDLMLKDIASEEEKGLFKEGANAFEEAFQHKYNKTTLKGTTEEYQNLLEEYFNIPQDKKNRIFEMLRNDSSIKEDEFDNFLIYNFLIETRKYTLYGYFTSEHVGEQVLSYDPIPGEYKPCIQVEEVGNAWSLR